MSILLERECQFGKKCLIIWSGFFFALTGNSYAALWQFEPMFSLTERYNNNANFSSSAPESISEILFRGTLSFKRRSETSELDGRADLNLSSYSKRYEFFTFSGKQTINEKSRWKLNGNFRRDSTIRSVFDTDGVSQTTDENGENIDVDAGLVQVEIRRNSLQLTPSIAYRVTERTNVGFAYDLKSVFYNNNRVASGLFDYYRHGASVISNASLSERDSVSLVLGVSRFSSIDNANTINDGRSLSIKYGRLLSEISKLELELGASNINNKNDLINSDKNSFSFNTVYSYKGSINKLRIELGRDIRPSGSGSLVDVNRIRLGINRKINEKFSWLFRLRAFETKQSGSQTRKIRYIVNLRSSVKWALSRWWSVRAGYIYRYRNEKNSSNDANSHSVFTTIQYRKATIF